MNQLLDQIIRIEQSENPVKNKKIYAQWVNIYQQELKKLNKKQQSHYLILLSQIYATKLKDIDGAYQCLKKIQLNSQLITFEHKLRFCYYRYLEGNYDQALNDLSFIEMADKSQQFKLCISDFFRRILAANDKQGNRLYQYERHFIKAIIAEHQHKLIQARKTHTLIYEEFYDINQYVSFQAASHIISLSEQIGDSSAKQLKKYKAKVVEYEAKIQNKNYYKLKTQFLLRSVKLTKEIQDNDMDILNEQQPHNRHTYARIYMYLQMKKSMSKLKDKNKIALIQTTMKQLKQDDNQEINSACYKFVGDKNYKKFKLSFDKIISLQPVYNKMYSEFMDIFKKKYQTRSKGSKMRMNDKSNSILIKNDLPKNTTFQYVQSQQVDHDQNKQDKGKFKGSNMTKIHQTSNGFVSRYFYIQNDFKNSMKLFYCDEKKDVEEDNEYYKIKNLKRIIEGKTSEPFKRKQCQEFDQQQCFTLKMQDQQRSFYVKEQQIYENWIKIFDQLIKKEEFSKSAVKKTKFII